MIRHRRFASFSALRGGAFLTLFLFSACGVDRANEHLEHMNRNTDRMAQELEHDRAYVQALTKSLEGMQKSIESMSDTMKLADPIQKYLGQLATAVLDLKKMSEQVFSAFLDSMAPKEPVKTPDMGDFFEDAPTEGTQK